MRFRDTPAPLPGPYPIKDELIPFLATLISIYEVMDCCVKAMAARFDDRVILWQNLVSLMITCFSLSAFFPGG